MSYPKPWPLLTLSLPPWIDGFLATQPEVFASDEERMAVVLELCRRNVEEGTGGPFAAAVFEAESGRLVAPGLNRVEPEHCSVAHAEMVALMAAQQRWQTYDLSDPRLPASELFTSAEPCAMCYGAVPWSGIRRLVFGARKSDAEAVGFDEGTKPRRWIHSLESRGIAVRGGVLRRPAAALLQAYAARGATIYNPRSRSTP
jgi:tRNA(Arg) A34 adenosine deaminase TadA